MCYYGVEDGMSETAKLNYIDNIERKCQLGTRLIHVNLYLSVLSFVKYMYLFFQQVVNILEKYSQI